MKSETTSFLTTPDVWTVGQDPEDEWRENWDMSKQSQRPEVTGLDFYFSVRRDRNANESDDYKLLRFSVRWFTQRTTQTEPLFRSDRYSPDVRLSSGTPLSLSGFPGGVVVEGRLPSSRSHGLLEDTRLCRG